MINSEKIYDSQEGMINRYNEEHVKVLTMTQATPNKLKQN